jgi:membrane fusion protein (multidrug efflux system)
MAKIQEMPKKMGERKKPVLLGKIILIVLIAGGLGTGALWLNDTFNYVSTDDAAVDGDHVSVSSKILGRVKTLLASERDSVKAGQLLVELDLSDLRAQEAQAQASLKYAKENLVLAKVNLDRTLDDFQRTKTLYAKTVVTKEQFIHASKSLDTARAQYSIAQAQVETSQAQLGILETQIVNTRITAPITGVIVKKAYMVGDVVQPGQAIYTINDLGKIWITANYEETKIRNIKAGAAAIISIDAYPGKTFQGTVRMISAGIVPPAFSIGEFTKTTQRVPVKIEFGKTPDNLVLLPGMSVEVKIKIGK